MSNDEVIVNPDPPDIVVITDGASTGTIESVGTQGVSGPPGLSAYDVAVENGFPGTEEEWLASLNGSYKHVQAVASTEWTVNHNLGFFPNAMVIDSGGSQVIGLIEHVDEFTLIARFNAPFGGTIYCS